MAGSLGVLTTALGLALMGMPWELHFSAHHVAAVAVTLAGITVVAQGQNAPALRTFEGCGFRTADVGLWFHKWYES